ncbi:hypothetical protein OPIT5_28585 [Opitutaceae bacterium TAV5]|nr:hypothetical protein OPIT5_28585 [Opitutaceae bacterium TAV5]
MGFRRDPFRRKTASAPHRRTWKTVSGAAVGILFGLIFVCIGFGIIWSGFLKPAWQWFAVRSWTETPCIIASSRFTEADILVPDSRPTLEIAYAYTYNGRDYRSTRIGIRDNNDTLASLEKNLASLAGHYATGTRASCRVNPDNPSEAVLIPDFPQGIWPALVFGVFWTLFSGGFTATAVLLGVARQGETRSADADAPDNVRQPFATRLGIFGIVVVFGFCFFSAGAFVFIREAAIPLHKAWSAHRWIETPCIIVASSVQRSDSGDGSRVYIVYEYTCAGRTRRGTRYHFSDSFSSGIENHRKIVNAHPVGQTAVCFVNPENPDEAVFNRDVPLTAWIGIPFGGVFMLVGGSFVGGWLWFTFGKRRTGDGNVSPLGKRLTGTVSPSAATSPAPTAAPEAGWHVLPPEHGIKTAVAGLLFATLFWNGIVSVFLIICVSGWLDGEGDLFLSLFLVPFVAVGLGLLGKTAGALLRLLAGDSVTLEIDRPDLVPGQTLRLRYTLRGNISRIRKLRIRLLATREDSERQTRLTGRRYKPVLLETALFDRTGTHDLHLPPDLPLASAGVPLKWTLHFAACAMLVNVIEETCPVRVAAPPAAATPAS